MATKRIRTRDPQISFRSATTTEAIQSHENMPILSLDDAVKPLVALVPDIQESVSSLKALCCAPADNLSSDESAAIMLYTFNSILEEESLYFLLNRTLRTTFPGSVELKPWLLYLRLLTSSLCKLPPIGNATLYRGIKDKISLDDFSVGKIFVWSTFVSCSLQIDVQSDFLGQTGFRVLFIVQSYSGKDITKHSYYPDEREVLIPAGKYFEVVRKTRESHEFYVISIKEIERPASLGSMLTMAPHCQRLINQIRAIPSCSEIDLREQHLSNQDIGIIVREAIIDKQCTEIHLQKNNIGPDGASMIASVLEGNNTLYKLWLDNNAISDTGVHALAKVLALDKSSLQNLGLNANRITDDGAKAICEMLKMNKTVTFLRLAENELTNQGIIYLADTLGHHNRTLTHIDLSLNKLVDDNSIDHLIQMIIRNQSLMSVTILNCNLSDRGKQRFRSIGQLRYGFKLCL